MGFQFDFEGVLKAAGVISGADAVTNNRNQADASRSNRILDASTLQQSGQAGEMARTKRKNRVQDDGFAPELEESSFFAPGSTYRNSHRKKTNRKPGAGRNFQPQNNLRDGIGGSQLPLSNSSGNNVSKPSAPTSRTPAQERRQPSVDPVLVNIRNSSSKRRKVEETLTSSPGHKDTPILVDEDESSVRQLSLRHSPANSIKSSNHSHKNSTTPLHRRQGKKLSEEVRQQKRERRDRKHMKTEQDMGAARAAIPPVELTFPRSTSIMGHTSIEPSAATNHDTHSPGATGKSKMEIDVEVHPRLPDTNSPKHSLELEDYNSAEHAQKRRRPNESDNDPELEKPSDTETTSAIDTYGVSRSSIIKTDMEISQSRPLPSEPMEGGSEMNKSLDDLSSPEHRAMADVLMTAETEVPVDSEIDELQLDLPGFQARSQGISKSLLYIQDTGNLDEVHSSDKSEAQAHDIPAARVRKQGDMVVCHYSSLCVELKTRHIMRYNAASNRFELYNEKHPDRKLVELCMNPLLKMDLSEDSVFVNLLGSRNAVTSYVLQIGIRFATVHDCAEFINLIKTKFKHAIKLIHREKGTMKSHFDSALKTNLVFRSTAIDAGEEQSFLAHKVETWNSKTGSSNTIKSLSLAANSAMPQLLQPKKRGNTKVSQMKGGDSNDEDSRRVIKSRNTRVSFGGTKDSTSIPRTHASVKGNDQSKRQLRNKSSNSSSQFKADKQYDQQLEDEEHGYSSGRLRNKPREPSPKPIIRFSESNDLGPEWDQPVHYPLTGKKRAVVEFSDLLRLDDGEFLNDNLLEFYTRYMEGTFEPKPKQVYCFNSHLYSRLTSGVRGRLNYEAVARWTKDVDLFEYDYLIVPINEYSHWYLAIICNAKNLLRTNGMPTEEVDLEAVDDTQDNSAPGPLPVVLNESSSGLKEAVIKALNPSDPDPDPVATADLAEGPSQGSPGSEVAQLQDLSLKEQLEVPDSQENPLSSAGEEHQPDNAVREQLNPMAGSLTKVPVTDKQEAQKTSVVNSSTNAASVRKGPRRKTAPVRKYAPNDTIVAILDSMGSARPAAISNLKAYLTAEAKDKKNIEIDRANIKGANMTNGIPQQNTWYDCGLYVCGYIRKFMQNPEEFGRKLLAQNFDLETDWPEMNALEMRDEMRTLLQNMARDQAEIRKKQKAEKKKAKKAAKIAQVASAAPAAGSSSPTPLNVTRPLAIPPTAPEESNTKEKTLEATHMDEKAAKPATPTPKDAQLPRSPTKIQQAQDAMPELKVVDNISNTPRKASRVPGSPSKFDWTKLPRSQGEKSPAETAVRFETSPEPGLSFMDGFRHKAKVNHIPALSAPKLESHNSLNAALSANPKFPSQQEKSSSELHASYKGTPTLFDAQRDFKQDDSSSVANSSPKKFATSRTMVNLEQETVDEVILLVPPPTSCDNDDDHFDSELSKGFGPVDLTQGEEVMHSHTRRKALPVKRISMNTGEASSQSALQSVKRVSSKAADTRAGNDIDGS